MMKKKYKWFSFTTERENAEINVFCFPHAGAGASIYAPWGKKLPEKYSFFPVQLPMRENRRSEKVPAAMKELGRQAAFDNADLFKSRPFVLFGHCFGALAAYETAVTLQKEFSCSPILLITAASGYPHIVTGAADLDSMDREALVEHFVGLGYITREMTENEAYLDFFIPALKADCGLVHKYEPEGIRVNCPIYAPYGCDDNSVSAETAEKWKDFTSAASKSEVYDGGHFFLDADSFPEMLEKGMKII